MMGPYPTPIARLLGEERGSATVELVLLTPLLVAMLMFIVYFGRLADASQAIQDAAHQAARAASQARTPAAAIVDARSIAQSALTNAGITCQSVTVDVDTHGLRPGGIVSATVTCTVDISDLALLNVPGTKSLDASFFSVVDTWRSKQQKRVRG